MINRPLVLAYDGKSSERFFVTSTPELCPEAQNIQNAEPQNTNDFANISIARYLDTYDIDSVFSSRLDRLRKDLREKAGAFLIHPHEDEKSGTAEFIKAIRGQVVVILYSSFPPLRQFPLVEGFTQIYQMEEHLVGVEKLQGLSELIQYLVLELGSRSLKIKV